MSAPAGKLCLREEEDKFCLWIGPILNTLHVVKSPLKCQLLCRISAKMFQEWLCFVWAALWGEWKTDDFLF